MFNQVKEKIINWLLKDIHIYEGHFGKDSVTLTDLITMTLVTPSASGQIGMDLPNDGRPTIFRGGAVEHLVTTEDVPSLASGIDSSTEIVVRAGPATGPSQVTVGDVEAFELPDGGSKDVVVDFQLPIEVDLITDNPTVTFRYVVTIAGGGNADVDFNLFTKYIGVTEQVDKADDESLSISAATINIVDEVHSVTFNLNKSLIADDDRITLRLERAGAADAFSGAVAVLQNARFDFDS